MSYILDALRRADAERRRGQAPALQQVAGLQPEPPPRRASPWRRLAPMLLVVAVAAVVALMLRPAADPRPAPPRPAAAVPPPLAMAPAPLPAAARADPAPAAVPVVTLPRSLPAPAPSAPAASAPSATVTASALPEPQRSAVQRLAFGGAVQSQDRSQSFVLLAGQIVHEGEAVAPGITLEQIGTRTLILRVNGQRVTLPL